MPAGILRAGSLRCVTNSPVTRGCGLRSRRTSNQNFTSPMPKLFDCPAAMANGPGWREAAGHHLPDPSRVAVTKPSRPTQSQRRSPRSMPPQPPNEWQRVDCFERLVPFPPSGLRATLTTPRQILGSPCFQFQEPWRWLNCNSLASGVYVRFPRLLALEPRATAVPCHAHLTSTVISHRETADWT